MATSLSGGTRHAFVWRDGVWTNLNSLIPPESQWELQSSGDINDLGQIVGSGEAPGGSIQGYLLTPVSTGVEDEIAETLPVEFTGLVNYPNPFNASTTIKFELSYASFVTLDVFNVRGQKVATIVESELPPGAHQVTWNAETRASGVYYYRIKAGDISETRRMVLLK
jgi:hypothetical protein